MVLVGTQLDLLFRKRCRTTCFTFTKDRGERVDGRIANVWFVRAGLGDPTLADRSVSRFLRSLYLGDKCFGVSATTVARAKDAFAELVVKFNRLTLRDLSAKYSDFTQYPIRQSLFVVHLHDEASFRVRSSLAAAANDDDVDMSGVRLVNRSASSKVQNHCVTLSIGGERIEWLAELQAMERKDASTIAKTLQSVAHEIIAQVLEGVGSVSPHLATPSKPRVLHLLTGDGIGTNQAATRRLLKHIIDSLSASGVDYYVAMWTCASHVVSIIVQVGASVAFLGRRHPF